jgi:glyoxylase-like metal-dependent hydrolase (beta-lactamase superfamily II)
MTQELGHGITCIDSFYIRPRLACYYLVQQGDELAIIDTGTSRSVPRLLELLRERGLAPGQVRYVIPTHVHLDHAGGAGVMMREFPRASLVVHPRGARHLVDPGKLVAGSIAVYGERRFQELYGDILAVEAGRVVEAQDGMTLDLAGRPLLIRDTPGHADHHLCIWDETSRGWFSGDVFGISYPELCSAGGFWLLPTTTPVQFAPEKLLASIRLLVSYRPDKCYLTHFGEFTRIAEGAGHLCRQVEAYRDIALACAQRSERVASIREELWRYTLEQLAASGLPGDPASYRELLAMDLDLNAQGLDVWLSRRAGSL